MFNYILNEVVPSGINEADLINFRQVCDSVFDRFLLKSLSREAYIGLLSQGARGHDAFVYLKMKYGTMTPEDCLIFYKEHLKKPIRNGDVLANVLKLHENFKIFIDAVGSAKAFSGVILLDLLDLKEFTTDYFRRSDSTLNINMIKDAFAM